MPFARLAPRADLGGRPGAARGYGTTDPLEEVLGPDYFGVARALLRPGALIDVSTVMVRADAQSPERADGAVRLVQDFGRPHDPGPGDGARARDHCRAAQARPRSPARQPHQESRRESGRQFPGTRLAGLAQQHR